ncbi:MAG: tRNA pseudouridine(13) synthase TruD [Candidatus Diapherotrites archaeon]
MNDCGLKYFSSTTPALGGRIKRRIADFKVKEITLEGKALELKAFNDDSSRIELEKKFPEKIKGKEQLLLTMEKFNYDTINSVKIISRKMGLSQKRIGYAGLKDKRAITVQKISVWNPEYEKIKSFNSRYIDLRDAEWSSERIEIGKLKGNEFEIIIREINKGREETKEIIEKCFNEIQKGIPNYFGEQRFGGIRKISHKAGKEFLTNGVKEGVMVFLSETNELEEKEISEARKHLSETLDFKKALNEFPKKYRHERAILNHLSKYPEDFVNAFRALPKSMCYLFTHAYQSYLFNRIINKRIEKGIGLEKIKEDELIEGIPSAQLIGFNSKFSEGILGEIEREILEEEEISFEDFKVKEMNELSTKGAVKKIKLIPEKLKLIEVSEDEFNEGKTKAKISFSLEKGTYATNILREIIKGSLD